MLATAWTWPYAPQGVPALTKCMVRVDPGDFFDGVGWSRLTVNAAAKVENEYVMWRQDVFAETPEDTSQPCYSGNEVLHPRIADKEWTAPGAAK